MVIVNAPWTVKALWAIVSPWLDDILKAKVCLGFALVWFGLVWFVAVCCAFVCFVVVWKREGE